MGDWRGDHYKSSDEANAAGWLRYLFVREEGDALLIGQAVPREWLRPGQHCGIERTATYFGPASVLYTGGRGRNHRQARGSAAQSAQGNPPALPRPRAAGSLSSVTVNGKPWKKFKGEWVQLPGNIGTANVVARYSKE